jgi:tagatose 1,6-diphosphate aldolase
MSVIDDEAVASPDPAVTTGLIQGWSVAQAKRLGATGIKVYFFYNHREAEPAAREEAVICKLVEECAQAELPLFAEPIHYGVEPGARRRLVIENARRISDLGADVLKLEFPVDVRVEPDERIWRDACEELSQALPRPWTLLSAGVDYATFRRQAEVACAAGASGFVAGRAIWQEASDLDGAARTAFLQNVAAARLQELSVLGNRYGRSWRAFFDAAPVAPDWYMTYPGTL